MLQIKSATQQDFDRVQNFYYVLIDQMKSAVYSPGWKKDIYPSREYLAHAIAADTLYIGEMDGEIVASMIADHSYNPRYRDVPWNIDAADDELLIIHTLGVHPAFSGKSIAKKMVQKVIEIAKEQGLKTIRLDVLNGNIPAEKVYTKMGFIYLTTIQMFYEDTGWTDYKVFEYKI